MIAAATLCESLTQEIDIHLFEKNNKLGAKVIISWWGRCNVTTGIYKKDDLLKNYPRWAEFLEYSFSKFWPRKVRNWFENHGVPLKEEADKRIFPISNKGTDLVWIFDILFADKKVHLHFNESVVSISEIKNISESDKKFQLTSASWTYNFDYIIITTWGNAYAHTWSTGDWYTFARALWHTITPLWPSLNSFLIKEERVKILSGISFATASLRVDLDKTMKAEWPVLLTHFGISWPATFVIAAYSAFETIDASHPLKIYFKPFASYDQNWRNIFFLDQNKVSPQKELHSILGLHFPKRFVQEFLSQSTINPQQKICHLSKKDRETLTDMLWNWICLTAISRRAWDEFVTAWWVTLSEVNPQTMESLICPWLFFAGEILDVDGFTGGFNLQSSRATGMVAGWAIVEKCK